MRQFLKHHISKDVRHKLLVVERYIKLLAYPRILRDLYDYNQAKKEIVDERFTTNLKDIFPVGGENTKYTSFDRHYVYHTSWAARVVREIKRDSPSPKTFRHVDISSSLYFSGIVSAFVPVDFYDYRPADLRLEGLTTQSGDLMDLPFESKSVESISCLHTIEHVGLGRYGDPIDPLGDTKAIKELMRVVKQDGNLIIVVPVGRQRIQFNAHRIYNPAYIKDFVCQGGQFELKEYAFIPETDKEGGIERDTSLVKGRNSEYACGCFWFIRKSSDVNTSSEDMTDETIDEVPASKEQKKTSKKKETTQSPHVNDTPENEVATSDIESHTPDTKSSNTSSDPITLSDSGSSTDSSETTNTDTV